MERLIRAGVLFFLLSLSGSALIAQPKGWTSQKTGGTQLRGVHFLNRDTGWAVGGFLSADRVDRTTDGGKTWTTVSTGLSDPLYNVWVIDENTVVATGENSIIRTSNGGTDWTSVHSASGGHLRGLFFVDLNNGWAVGQSIVRRTTNGGESWSTQTSNTTSRMHAVAFVSSTTGTAVGQKTTTQRTLLRTTTGTSWTATDSESNPMYGISFASATVGVAVGKYGTFIRTTNGGANWGTDQFVDLENRQFIDLNAVDFGSSTHAWLVTNNGEVMVSKDAGVSWTEQASPANGANLFAVHFIDQYTGTIVGSGGLIMRTSTGGEAVKIALSTDEYSFGEFTGGTEHNVFLRIGASIDSAGYVILDSLRVKTGGTYATADIDAFRLWYSVDSEFDPNTATALATAASASGTGETITFDGFTCDIDSAGGYLFVTADISESADPGTITGSVLAFSDLGFSIAGTIPSSATGNVFPMSGGEQTLPVQMTNVTAMATASTAELRWRTESEVGNYGWEIERREMNSSTFTVHHSPWTTIGFVQGAGTSSSPKDYSFVDKPDGPGRYAYRIKQIDLDGSFTYSAALEVELAAVPAEFSLRSYPNPFNPETVVEFSVPFEGRTSVKVFDLLGREVSTLVNDIRQAGVVHRATFAPAGLPSGTYLIRIEHEGMTRTVKVLLTR